MGVLNCVVDDCEKIMCDTYVNGIGYVCEDHKNEYVDHIESNNITLMTDEEHKINLSAYYGIKYHRTDSYQGITPNQFFDEYTNNHE